MPAPTIAFMVIGCSLAVLIWCMLSDNTERPRQNPQQGYRDTQLNDVDDSTGCSNSPIRTGEWNRNQRGNVDCTICLDSVSETDSVRVMSCSHMFHTRCIHKWFTVDNKRSCPNCRRIPFTE